MQAPVLSVENLSLAYALRGGEQFDVLNGISLTVRSGEIIGLAGESGSGKSTLALAAMGWRSGNSIVRQGRVMFQGRNLLQLSNRELKPLWGKRLAYLPQEVASSLNPARRVGAQLDEVVAMHSGGSKEQRLRAVQAMLEKIGIPSDREALSRYPFEFSGGQQQRIALAMAMLPEPEVLILDEPATGIDAAVKIEVFQALQALLAGRGTAAIYISHDLVETSALADRLVIMYSGEIVEQGPASAVFGEPRHPYTQALRAAVPTLDDKSVVEGIPGRPPGRVVAHECAFAPRCEFAAEACRASHVGMVALGGGREVRCIRMDAIAASRHRSRPLPAIVRSSSGDLLTIRDLSCTYSTGGGVTNAVVGVSLSLGPAETLGIVGESGSGKSTLLRTIAGLHRPAAGSIEFHGQPLNAVARQRTPRERGAIQLVFQNPERALNPRHTVERIMEVPFRLFRPDVAPAARRQAAAELLDRVQLSPRLLSRFPHQLSGGEKQRVALARAFAARPQLLLCDEVVSALDVSVQAGVMNLIADYARDSGAAVLFVTHDLAVVRMMSHHIIVMRNGLVCEMADRNAIFESPQHPYTLELLRAIPGGERVGA